MGQITAFIIEDANIYFMEESSDRMHAVPSSHSADRISLLLYAHSKGLDVKKKDGRIYIETYKSQSEPEAVDEGESDESQSEVVDEGESDA